MWLITTLIAAIVVTAIWYVKPKIYKLDILSLMLWGTSIMILVDHIVIAIGQGPNQMMDLSSFDKDRRGRIVVKEEDLETSIIGVYAGGDIISGNKGTVIYAAGCGLKSRSSLM